MVLGKLPVPERPTYLEKSRARAYCACSRSGWGLFGHFSLLYHFSFLSPSLWETARYRLKYCLKGPLSPKQPTNQPSRGGRVVKWCWVTFQCRCVLLIRIVEGQGPTALAVGAGVVVWIFLLSSIIFLPLFGRRPDID